MADTNLALNIFADAMRHVERRGSHHEVEWQRSVHFQDFDERDRLIAHLGDNRAMIMHNHGVLTVGRTAREAFILMKHLLEAAEIQLSMEATGGELIEIPPEVCKKTVMQYEKHDSGRGAADWPAYLRMLDRLDPSYRN